MSWMFRTRRQAVETVAIWAGLAVASGLLWAGVLWLVLFHTDLIVRGFIGMGMLVGCASFWRASDTRRMKAVAACLTVLVGYVALSILGVL